MKVIRQFVPVIISTETINNTVNPSLSYGRKMYHDDSLVKTFDTEEEAIAYAFEKDKYSQWVILPKISFDIW